MVGIAFEVTAQAYGNYATGKDVYDFGNYSGWDIAVAAGIGAVGPSAITMAQTMRKAPGAIAELSRQLATATTAARKAKLEARLAKYTGELADAVGISAALQLIKALLKEYDGSPGQGQFCPLNQ